MSPSKEKVVNGSLVQEYYWNGRYVVYVDHRKSDLGFVAACEKARAS